ncbi:MAG TPA: branched-chain amino acid ABC transporter permease/ATP-binding protein [Streptosporangiaceae bacterium]|nr:branched-chain amino acid ABC transporter permease/ATP-binding protein [Streptosporangiaceae bacterium]
MQQLLPFVVAGIASGAIYGMAATGLVLTYKTSGIFNFGHGALATAAAYIFYALHYANNVNWVLSLLVSVVVAGPLMGLGMERISRRISQQSVAWKIVATIGLILIVQGLGTVKYGSDTINVPQFLPKGMDFFRLGGVNISYAQLTVTLVGLAAVAGLYALFRWSRSGIAMRAVVDDPDLLAMQATSPIRVRRGAWIIGSTFAALSGVLVLPFIGLNAIALTYLVVQAFGAAAIGAFSSIPLTFFGAIVLEIVANISQKYVINVSWLAGLPDSLPFIVLFVVLLVLPRRRLAPVSSIESRPALQWQGPARVRIVTGVVVVALLALVPLVVGDKIGFFTIGLTQMIMLLSLGLLVKTSGQVSLCHAAFAAIGAVAFSQLTVGPGIPWFAALVIAGLIVVPVGAFVAIPAIRLPGLFLALATFGFGIFVEQMLYSTSWMFTTLSSGRAVPRPSFGSGDTGYYYVVLVIVVLTALIMVAIHEARLGRVLRGLSDSPLAVATMGLSTNTTRVIVFCISAFFAAVSGVLYAASIHFAVSSDTHFQSLYSLTLLALLALAPFAEPWYAIFGLVAAVIPAYLTSATVSSWLNAFFGVSAISVALQGGHAGMPARLRQVLEGFGRPRRGRRAVSAAPLQRSPEGQGLEVRNLRVAFGGLVAVDDLSFSVPLGRVTGLIGPNGAGKTTTFDACSGLNRRVSGRISLKGRDVTRLGASARGRLGLGRTFQRMVLCDRLTVAENVALGREAGLAGSSVLGQMVARRSQRIETEAAAWSAMDLCGIADLAGVQAGALSTGQRRLVEFARCLAGRFDVLILDEPSSGLDRSETAALDAILRRTIEERGCGILLVEHDMSLVMNVCDNIYVLDFGKLLFEGDPPSVAADPGVQAAYLGYASLEAAAEAKGAG